MTRPSGVRSPRHRRRSRAAWTACAGQSAVWRAAVRQDLPIVPKPALTPVQQDAIDAADASVAIIDDRGRIIAVNEGWVTFGAQDVREDAHRGVDATHPVAGSPGLASVLDGVESSANFTYPCHPPDVDRWFRMIAARMTTLPGHVLVVHRPIFYPVSSLQPAVEELTLRLAGIQTVCGWCGDCTRDPLGTWVRQDPAPGALLSHGICPVCETATMTSMGWH